MNKNFHYLTFCFATLVIASCGNNIDKKSISQDTTMSNANVITKQKASNEYPAVTYTLVVMMKRKLELKQSTYKILQILSITLLNKTQLNQLFGDTDLQNFKGLDSNQLNFF